ncbi:hypothetical protein XELAEV_18032033mg [Xenopus laevis]|uniref:Uncharacterized protein n=1 Tax=Xenopus laevis TaxID=8355 RepID=A0A974CQK9_XENLA|nr:hypothetical protein XELAEV_18032033mg [Xenopus laevis]
MLGSQSLLDMGSSCSLAVTPGHIKYVNMELLSVGIGACGTVLRGGAQTLLGAPKLFGTSLPGEVAGRPIG